jgi:hypothetical protein
MITAWMQSVRDRSSIIKTLIIGGSVLVGALATAVLASVLLVMIRPASMTSIGYLKSIAVTKSPWLLVLGGAWLAIALILLIYALRPASDRPREGASEFHRSRDLLRSQITNVHRVLLTLLVFGAVVLGFAGFSFEGIYYVFYYPGSVFYQSLAKVGGWGALLASIAGSIYTALKTAPTGGGG